MHFLVEAIATARLVKARLNARALQGLRGYRDKALRNRQDLGRGRARVRFRRCLTRPVRAGRVQDHQSLVAHLRHAPEPVSVPAGGRRLAVPRSAAVLAWAALLAFALCAAAFLIRSRL